MAKAEVTLMIKRPVEEVFGFLTDYESYSQWDQGIINIQREPEGPVKVGTKLTETRTFMGRKTQTVSEITVLEPNMHVSRWGDNPPARGEINFEAAGKGTQIKYSLEIEFGGVFSIAGPVLSKALKRGLQSDLKKFKEKIESGALQHSNIVSIKE